MIGLDFGTSSTKVVVQNPFGRSVATAIPWNLGNGGPQYLLPTALHENSTGELALSPDRESVRCHRDLKVNLMDDADNEDAQGRTAAYLGLVLREARRWLLEDRRDVYGRYRIEWTLHLGIPSAGYDDKPMRDTFRLVGRAAWLLSLQPDPPTPAASRIALRRAAEESQPSVPIDVVPEIAAEVVGYARSRGRNDGLHVMVDVGASTIDICGFVLHSLEGDDRYELLTAVVERLGVHELHLRRRSTVLDAGASMSSELPAQLDPLWRVPADGTDYVVEPSESLCCELKEVDFKYVKDVTNAVMRVIVPLRRQRDPYADHWLSGLPVFLAGGGAQFGPVVESINEADTRLRRNTRTKGIDNRILAFPGAFTNHDVVADMADRLCVAYGLSFDRLEIGDITPPHEIEDVPDMPIRPSREYISKEQE
ncbi:MAG: hypothetical protein F4Z04_04720 [Acidobacteria bacterium]|nr:hypothetical protein [Acidobacteriota bacterium]